MEDEVTRLERQEAEVAQHLHEIYECKRRHEAAKDPTFRRIPRFFHKKPEMSPPHPEGIKSAAATVRELSKQRFLAKQECQILDDYDLKQIEMTLKSHQDDSGPFGREMDHRKVNYDHFCSMREQIPQKARKYFTAQSFLSMLQDEHGRIDKRDFYEKLCQTNDLAKTRITLYHYDSEGKGFLKETDLEMYIYDKIATMPMLMKMHENFVPYYVFTAVRRFMFFLDPKKTGKISIETLVSSDVMKMFLDLKEMHENLPPKQLARNWFSLQNAMSVYSTYLNLDEDENGMLNKRELIKYEGRNDQQKNNPVKLTEAFVDRVFEEIITYKMNEEDGESEMDYKTFLDFALAMENKSTLQALQYFWKLLDVQKTGYLNTFTINYFFRDVLQELIRSNLDTVDVADVKDEIYDMVKPKDPLRITFDDLYQSNVGHTIVSMLIDVNGFWAYDNRESMNYDEDDEEEEEEEAMAHQSPSVWNNDDGGSDDNSPHVGSGNLLDGDDPDNDF